MRIMLPILLTLLLSSCSMLMEHRSYVDEMDREPEGFFVANEDFPVVPGDTGNAFRSKDEITKRTPASRGEKIKSWKAKSLTMELAAKERDLKENSPEDYKLYQSYLKLFSSDSQKLYYLSLNTQGQRSFLYSLDRSAASKSTQGEGARAPASNPSDFILSVGMSKRDVIGGWGKPQNVAIAGSAQYQNEKWSYSGEGGERSIYFEQGVVQGWELP